MCPGCVWNFKRVEKTIGLVARGYSAHAGIPTRDIAFDYTTEAWLPVVAGY
jgi:hypothetical protein